SLGDAVTLPGCDRRRARPGCEGARDLLVPLPGGRVAVRALPGAQDDLPGRLSLRLRLPRDSSRRVRRARPFGVRRPCAGRGRAARTGPPRREGSIRPRAGAGEAWALMAGLAADACK